MAAVSGITKWSVRKQGDVESKNRIHFSERNVTEVKFTINCFTSVLDQFKLAWVKGI